MFRELLLCLGCLATVISSHGNDDLAELPICGEMGPDDIYLDLSNINLDAIHKPFASSSAITCLNLAGNRIGHIATNAFDGLSELHYLNLAGSPIWYDDFVQTKLTKLRTLVLDGPFNEDNDNHRSRQYYQNQELSFSLSLPELEKLSLKNYEYDKRDLIPYTLQILKVPNLTHLYLSGSKITDGELSYLLSSMNNLTNLYLDGNEFQNLRGPSLQNLRYLSVNRNRFQSLGIDHYNYGTSMITRGMSNMEYLSIADNEITRIGTDAFQSLENLRSLNMAGNKIDDIPSSALTYLVNLQNLTLDNNLLTSVPHICALTELRRLSLRGNQIASINETTFCNLRYVSTINLRNNDLRNITVGTFGNLPALLALDLSWNKIVSLPEHWIMPHNFIVELRLDANRFTDIDSMSLKKIQGLRTFSMGHNPLKRIKIMSLMDLPNSTDIDVSREFLPPSDGLLDGEFPLETV